MYSSLSFASVSFDVLSVTEKLRGLTQDNQPLLFALVAGSIVMLAVRYYSSPWRKLPPGPRGLPFLGNAIELANTEKQWLRFSEWRKVHGDIFSLNAAGQPLVVINSQKIATDLLDRRANIYSDRPELIVASEIMCGGLLLPFTRFNDVWTRMRKAAHESVHKPQDFYEYQATEALLLARGGLQDAPGWNKHVRRAAASMTTSCIYNKPTITSEQDGRIGYIQGFAARATSAAAPGAHWAVEQLPWMRYIPSRWAPWKHTAEEWHRKDSEIFLQLYGQVRDKVTAGDDQASICATLIRNADRHGLSDLESAWTAAALYAAGSDPVFAVMLFWSLAMLVYPDTQKRAQQELDTVVGRARVPTFADMPHLPYIRAMVKEANRWASALPLAVPHRSTQDDFYENYFIPKGTIVVANTWELNRDPEVYGSDVHCFNPARFLDEKGKVISGPPGSKGEGHFTFGFGKRICVGRAIADNSLFINIATCLWAFSMTNVEGQKLKVGESDDDGLTIRPKPFDVEIQPRFPGALTLLSHECELRGQ